MIYQFITDDDLDVGMKQYYRDQIALSNSHILKMSEGAAFSLMKAKLNGRYDLTKLFPETREWNLAKAYLKDQYSYKNQKFYKALQDSINKDPETESQYWEENDPRDMVLVIMCVKITVYLYCDSLPSRKIPTDIVTEYSNAEEWLDDCKNGIESPDWPLLENGTGTIPWGSNEKLDHYY